LEYLFQQQQQQQLAKRASKQRRGFAAVTASPDEQKYAKTEQNTTVTERCHDVNTAQKAFRERFGVCSELIVAKSRSQSRRGAICI
jgi:hypothetical protein